jgi:hypothetical protein
VGRSLLNIARHRHGPFSDRTDNLRALVLAALAASPRDGLNLVARSAMVGLAPPARVTNERAGEIGGGGGKANGK